MEEIIVKIKDNFLENPEEALGSILGILDKQSSKYDDFLMLKSRFILIVRQSNQDVISREDYEVELNQIKKSFLYFLNKVSREDLASKSTRRSDLFSFGNELAAYEEIEEEVKKSRKIKLHCIRGSKLFKENKGLFDLLKYDSEAAKPNMFLDFKVLLLDYNNLNENEYQNLKESVTINWRGLQKDRDKLAQTMDRVKIIDERFTCKVRLYNVNIFQHVKLFIFDSNCYFTFYHKLGRAKKHQEYPLFKVDSNSSLYAMFERIFDTTWQSSNAISDENME